MAQYIDKDALVAEIDKRLHQLTDAAFDSMIGRNLIEIKDFLDSIEVKEVDLEKELSLEDYDSFFEKHPDLSDDWGFNEAWIFAKYFFELGLKAQKVE